MNASRVLFLLPLMGTPMAVAQPAGGDFLLLDGKILTVDSRDSVAQAVAVTGGRIVAVGTNATARQAAAQGAQVIDRKGRAVTPSVKSNRIHISLQILLS